VSEPAAPSESVSAAAVFEALSGLHGLFGFERTSDETVAICTLESLRYEAVPDFFEALEASGFAVRMRIKDKAIPATKAEIFKFLLSGQTRIKVYLDHGNYSQSWTVWLEVWDDSEVPVRAPRVNPFASRLWSQEHISALTAGPGVARLESVIEDHSPYEMAGPIDAVYTWVNFDDPGWRKLYREWVDPDGADVVDDAKSGARFISRDELKYSIRSVCTHLPWINHIYVVSNCEPPEWLDLEHPLVTWVDHDQIFPDTADLPTFNSHAIESCLHRIEGLSEHFLYFNDDFFIARDAAKSDFYEVNGLARLHLEPYGNVHGPVTEGDPDYLNAARNGQRIIAELFGHTALSLHTHTPVPMVKSSVAALESARPEDFRRTRRARFRSLTDISVTSFLYPQFAFFNRDAIAAECEFRLIQSSSDYRAALVRLLRDQASRRKLPLAFCLNDGNDSHENEDWSRVVAAFMPAFFAEPSPVERAPTESSSG